MKLKVIRNAALRHMAAALQLGVALALVGTVHAAEPPAGQGAAPGRMPSKPAPTVLGLSTFALVVADLDKSVAFYRDVIGLELISRDRTAQVDEARNAVTATPGAKRRGAILKIPNETYAIELDEYSGVSREPVRSNHNDPGSSFLNFGVLDAAKGFEVLRKAQVTLVGTGKIPSTVVPGHMAGVWIRDPDGHLIEYMQGGWDPERKALWNLHNVYRSHFGVTEERYGQALAFYRDGLGFDLTAGFPPMMGPGEYISAGPLAAGLGIPAEAHLTGVAGHCATARCEMFEFKDAPRTAFHPPLQDPGAAFLSMWVSDLDGLLSKLKAAGSEVVTAGGSPILVKVPADTWIAGYDTFPPLLVHSARQVMVRDPSGFPVLLMQRVD